MRHSFARIVLVVLAFVGLGVWSDEARAHSPKDQKPSKQLYVTSNTLGNVSVISTGNPGAVHVSGSVGITNTEFLRGAYDQLPEDFDQLGVPIALATAIELVGEQTAPLDDLSISVGVLNGLATNTPPGVTAPGPAELDVWYASDHFASLAGRVWSNWLASATYTAFASPNGTGTLLHELSFAVDYARDGWAGKLIPQVKFAVPLGEGSGGSFLQMKTSPAVTVAKGTSYPVTVAVPLTVGVGLDDYVLYGRGTNTSIYGAGGPSISVPLGFLPPRYGNWTLATAFDMIVRDDDIARVGGPFTTDDNIIFDVGASVSFAW